MLFKGRAGRDPSSQRFLLGGGQDLLRRGGRHLLVRIGGVDTGQQGRFRHLAGHHCDLSRLGRPQGVFGHIEPQAPLARLLVGTMAMEAGVRQDRANVAIESQRLGGGEAS